MTAEDDQSFVACEEQGCTREATFDSPRNLCAWHWCLWLSYGDVKEAKATMKELELDGKGEGEA